MSHWNRGPRYIWALGLFFIAAHLLVQSRPTLDGFCIIAWVVCMLWSCAWEYDIRHPRKRAPR